MKEIGRLDSQKLGAISVNIRSPRVFLIENQEEHIIKRRGQAFFNTYSPFFKEIVEDPDYIFRDRTRSNTIIVSKTVSLNGENINLVIRLAVESDEPGLENSIITAIVENNKRYQQRLRNNFSLYKKE